MMRVIRPSASALPGALALMALLSGQALGQDFRGWATTSVQAVELKAIGLDSVARSDVLVDSEGRFFYEGYEVTCDDPDVCTGYLPRADQLAVAATQDLGVTYWGLGVQGLSFTALARVRLSGGDLVWPRSEDEFDAMLAYAQLQRGPVRVRAGRQDLRSGLGFSAFDGLSASYALGPARAELYGGRSLARGLREPANEALRGLDDFYLDYGVYLFGGSLSVRSLGVAATARYQREILSDRSGLVSERASLDASTVVSRVSIRGSADYDFSFQRVGKAQLTASAPFDQGRWLVELSGRRYVPYFDLSTIWGYFEPVSYSEVMARLGWSPNGAIGAWVSGGARGYGDTNTTVIFEPMRDNGWRGDVGARWEPISALALSGEYQLEWGPGGFLSSVDLAARYEVTDRLSGSVSFMSFQQIEEYRLGEGRGYGGGISADYRWNERVSVGAGGSLIRHQDGGNLFTSPWNQARAWSSLHFELGGDPGLANRGGRR